MDPAFVWSIFALLLAAVWYYLTYHHNVQPPRVQPVAATTTRGAYTSVASSRDARAEKRSTLSRPQDHEDDSLYSGSGIDKNGSETTPKAAPASAASAKVDDAGQHLDDAKDGEDASTDEPVIKPDSSADVPRSDQQVSHINETSTHENFLTTTADTVVDAQMAASKPNKSSNPQEVLEMRVTPSHEANPLPETIPFRDLDQVMTWAPSFDSANRGFVPLQPRWRDHTKPKLLVCHDMKGGYVEDKHPQGTAVENRPFTIRYWHLIDTFVYFSHNLVSLPPPSWINASHRHGVKVLGTVITEWEKGQEICAELLSNKILWESFAVRLAEMMAYYRFDGWLINIENPVAPEQVSSLAQFVKHLRQECKARNDVAKVLWYDSVTTNGQLSYQNSLNQLNMPFFDLSDGIFLNYNWNPQKLAASAIAADKRHRKADVYAGVDCFGRGTYGGGKFNTAKGVAAAQTAKVSIALFAPGWAYENHDPVDYPAADRRFWSLIESELLGNPHCQRFSHPYGPLCTCFNPGHGSGFYEHGQALVCASSEHVANMSHQDQLPNIPLDALDPFYPGLGMKQRFKDVSLDISNKHVYQGHGSLLFSCRVLPLPAEASPSREAQNTSTMTSGSASPTNAPKCVCRLFATDVLVNGPLVLSLTYCRAADTATLPLEPTVTLLLDTKAGHVRYVDCHVAPASAEAGDNWDHEDQELHRRVAEKYGVTPSRHARQSTNAERFNVHPCEVIPSWRSLLGHGHQEQSLRHRQMAVLKEDSKYRPEAELEWQTQTFLLASHELKGRVVREIRLGLQPQRAEVSGTASFVLGKLQMFHAKELLKPLSPVQGLRAFNGMFERSEGRSLLSVSLCWEDDDALEGISKEIDHFNVFASVRPRSSNDGEHFRYAFLGKAFALYYRVHRLDIALLAQRLAESVSQGGTFNVGDVAAVDFVVQPVTHADLRLDLDDCIACTVSLTHS